MEEKLYRVELINVALRSKTLYMYNRPFIEQISCVLRVIARAYVYFITLFTFLKSSYLNTSLFYGSDIFVDAN